MQLQNNYHDCKLEVIAVIPGSLSSFLYAYCKTVNCPEQLEKAYIRKAVSFAKLSRFVRLNITNDFDGWYRMNEDSQNLCDVLANIINNEDNRTEIYRQPAPAKKLVSTPFYISGCNLELVLVQRS